MSADLPDEAALVDQANEVLAGRWRVWREDAEGKDSWHAQRAGPRPVTGAGVLSAWFPETLLGQITEADEEAGVILGGLLAKIAGHM